MSYLSRIGQGIPADVLPTIFDEYRQAEWSQSSVQKGTGLGLSITKKLAELLGGTDLPPSMYPHLSWDAGAMGGLMTTGAGGR